jgi:hypothetical protein
MTMARMKCLSRITASMLTITMALAFTPATAAGSVQPMSLAEAMAQQNGKAAPGCYDDLTITSLANDRYVSAEIGWSGSGYGLLRARATEAREWELFQVCFNGTNSTIRSMANGRYVSAEIGWSGSDYGLLRARATEAREWERFSFGSCGSDCTTIRSTANDRLVSAEIGWSGSGYGLLRARATAVGGWEQFA